MKNNDEYQQYKKALENDNIGTTVVLILSCPVMIIAVVQIFKLFGV